MNRDVRYGFLPCWLFNPKLSTSFANFRTHSIISEPMKSNITVFVKMISCFMDSVTAGFLLSLCNLEAYKRRPKLQLSPSFLLPQNTPYYIRLLISALHKTKERAGELHVRYVKATPDSTLSIPSIASSSTSPNPKLYTHTKNTFSTPCRLQVIKAYTNIMIALVRVEVELGILEGTSDSQQIREDASDALCPLEALVRYMLMLQ